VSHRQTSRCKTNAALGIKAECATKFTQAVTQKTCTKFECKNHSKKPLYSKDYSVTTIKKQDLIDSIAGALQYISYFFLG